MDQVAKPVTIGKYCLLFLGEKKNFFPVTNETYQNNISFPLSRGILEEEIVL